MRNRFGHEVTRNDDNTVTVAGPCMLTNIEHSVTYLAEEYDAWRRGRLLENAMPSRSLHDRSWLKDGICPTGWERMAKAALPIAPSEVVHVAEIEELA
jgi:hypothetical protein